MAFEYQWEIPGMACRRSAALRVRVHSNATPRRSTEVPTLAISTTIELHCGTFLNFWNDRRGSFHTLLWTYVGNAVESTEKADYVPFSLLWKYVGAGPFYGVFLHATTVLNTRAIPKLGFHCHQWSADNNRLRSQITPCTECNTTSRSHQHECSRSTAIAGKQEQPSPSL